MIRRKMRADCQEPNGPRAGRPEGAAPPADRPHRFPCSYPLGPRARTRTGTCTAGCRRTWETRAAPREANPAGNGPQAIVHKQPSTGSHPQAAGGPLNPIGPPLGVSRSPPFGDAARLRFSVPITPMGGRFVRSVTSWGRRGRSPVQPRVALQSRDSVYASCRTRGGCSSHPPVLPCAVISVSPCLKVGPAVRSERGLRPSATWSWNARLVRNQATRLVVLFPPSFDHCPHRPRPSVQRTGG